ncbi:hypothetical protein [Vogesella sp. LIG4]|uniref:hypothetical protein n=1 Tax=Vogesella sp. LIG4 TaxID=1192162 RepID=UPI0008201229|nr:hypothetical protein [Vogesella sp. LIG4]SCK24607.1 hypothetical protein PSELUDRAFT_2897 [Vogesella sp. LIG4]
MKMARILDLALTVRFELQRLLGLPGLLGLLLLVVAAVAWNTIPGVERHTRHLRDAARIEQARKAHYRNPAIPPATAPSEVLVRLPELFPPFSQNGADMAQILMHARANKLTLGAAQYQLTTEPSAHFTRYQVVLPIKDQYGSIRRFLAAVLNNMPNAALQEIHVERPGVEGSELDARVRFDLIYRAT